MKKQRETDADYVCGNIMQVFLTRSVKLNLYGETSFLRTDARAFDGFFTPHALAYTPWGHLYKRNIIKESGLTLREDMVCGEDALFNYQYLQHCSRIATTDEVVYYYNRLNSGSITKSYCPNRNRDDFLWLNERRRLYRGKLTAEQQYKEDDQLLLFFFSLYQDYAFFLSKAEAVEKMRETHFMYRPLLENVGTYGVDAAESPSLKAWSECRHLFDCLDYEGLYDYFCNRKNYRKTERRFPLARKIITRLRIFQLFKLKIG